MKKCAIVIGRFQPFHNAHAHLISEAKQLAERVVVFIGSANQPRTPKNPFTHHERAAMIHEWAKASGIERDISIVPLSDHETDIEWVADIRNAVSTFDDKDIVVVGCDKDSSTYYVNDCFPMWAVHPVQPQGDLNATAIRARYFSDVELPQFLNDVNQSVPSTVIDFLVAFKETEEYKYVVAEKNAIERYRELWSVAPYPVTFVTVDAVVFHQDRVLLIRRGRHPGKGLWAVPGGFLDAGELIKAGALRELDEETQLLSLCPDVAKRINEYLIGSKVIDTPNRSARGRVISHVYGFKLPDDAYPSVKADDDAAEVKWVSIHDLQPSMMFEDHYTIIRSFINNQLTK